MEAEEWKANPIVWGYFIPLNFFFSLSFVSLLTFLPKCTVGMWHAIKSICKRSSAEQKPYDVLLIPTLSFDYSTIILYLCKLERKGRLNNPIIYNTLAAQKPQCKMCFRRFWYKLAHSPFVLFCSNGVIISRPQYPSCYQNKPQWNSNLRWTRLLGQLYSTPFLEQ